MKCVFDHFDTEVNFELPEDSFATDPSDPAPKPFRDPAAVRILTSIATGLCQNGFPVDDAHLGKGCPAICSLLLKDRRIHIMLFVAHDSGVLNCHLETFCSQSIMHSLLRRDPLDSPQLEKTWIQLCGAIDKSLKEIESVRLVQWHRLGRQRTAR